MQSTASGQVFRELLSHGPDERAVVDQMSPLTGPEAALQRTRRFELPGDRAVSVLPSHGSKMLCFV